MPWVISFIVSWILFFALAEYIRWKVIASFMINIHAFSALSWFSLAFMGEK